MTQPDIFINVHKGIRRALFETTIALGRADGDERRAAAVRAQLREVLHFVAHHGDNEDVLLIPLLDQAAPALAERMRTAHTHVDAALHELVAIVESAPIMTLYHRTCEFVALYLEHIREEEQQLDPQIRAVLTPEQLSGFGRGSVERTAPADQRMMLGWIIPALTPADAQANLAKLPSPLADQLRPLVA